MGSLPSSDHCLALVSKLFHEVYSHSYRGSINTEDIENLQNYCGIVANSEIGDEYSKPMVWIGIYIAVASLFCILAMVADLLHGFRNRKLWFPCKYFTLNAASITVITVAMKLPVDLNNPMPGRVDQAAKLGSMTFMCTMMANLLPSLASVDNKELLTNVIGLIILVITMVVNVLIQIKTGLLAVYFSMLLKYLYVGIILSLLLILTSLAVTTPTLKRILELKYQAAHKTTSDDDHLEHTRMSTVEELIKHVRRYWVMAKTCCPQFVMASTSLCSAAGVICVFSTVIHFVVVVPSFTKRGRYEEYDLGYNFLDFTSDYKLSSLLILITQSVGVAIGTISPIVRCFSALSFRLSIKWSGNQMKVFKVERYWTQKLSEWKQSRIDFPFGGSHRSKALAHNAKNLFLSFCIGIEKVVVVSCKMIGLIPLFVVIVVVYCLSCSRSLKVMFFATSIALSNDTVQELEQEDTKEDLSKHVLLLQDEMELAKSTLKGILNSMNRLIRKAEKQQHSNLLRLLEKSSGFKGVETFDSDEVQPLPSIELLNCWSLPVVTLTCIAIALPNIHKDMVDSLFNGVGEGISYTRVLEESLNTSVESINIQKATKSLWHEVEDNCKWLGNTLRSTYKGKTSMEILKWFADKAKEIAEEITERTSREPMENSRDKLIVANSMYRIAQTIMLDYQSNIEQISEDQLFALLSGMIADILVASFTNLPRVISMKFHESAIEKREASVEAATKLLGRTKEIINKLQGHELPNMDPDQMASIDEWHAYLRQTIP